MPLPRPQQVERSRQFLGSSSVTRCQGTVRGDLAYAVGTVRKRSIAWQLRGVQPAYLSATRTQMALLHKLYRVGFARLSGRFALALDEGHQSAAECPLWQARITALHHLFVAAIIVALQLQAEAQTSQTSSSRQSARTAAMIKKKFLWRHRSSGRFLSRPVRPSAQWPASAPTIATARVANNRRVASPPVALLSTVTPFSRSEACCVPES